MPNALNLKTDPSIGHWKYHFDKRGLSYCPHFAKLLDLNPWETLSRAGFFTLVSAEFLGALLYDFKLARLRGTNIDIQVPVHVSGEKRWIRVCGTIHYRRWGDPAQMIGTIEDVSQQVHEEKLSMAILNHELRTPLTVIRLHAEMLNIISPEPAGTKYEGPAKHILFQTDRIVALMDEFASVSFDRQRERTLNRSAFTINELIERTVTDLKLVDPRVRFEYRPPEVIAIKADKFMLTQVLINYLSNAIKFSPSNPLIRIESYEADGWLEVAVHDEGIGFPAGYEQKIFEKFYRLDNQAGRQSNSKGLGLFLVKEIIEQHGGSVRAVSGRTSGASFYFTIPLQL